MAEKIEKGTKPGVSDKERLEALHKIGIFTDLSLDRASELKDRCAVLSMDGGGYHIIWTLTLLKRVEEITGQPCNVLFDVMGGTSAGALTSPILARKGGTAARALDFWKSNDDLYTYQYWGAGIIDSLLSNPFTRTMGNASIKFFMEQMTPLYNKENLRKILKEQYGDMTLADVSEEMNTAIVLLIMDLESGSPIRLSAFPQSPDYGFPGSLVRGALESAGSAPMASQPLGSYIDAGYGLFNNPVMAIYSEFIGFSKHLKAKCLKEAQIARGQEMKYLTEKFYQEKEEALHRYIKFGEAITHDTDDDIVEAADDGPAEEARKNKKEHMVMSFGTSTFPRVMVPEERGQNPLMPGTFWNSWYSLNVFWQASSAQDRLMNHAKFFPGLGYRRFQMSLNQKIIREKLPNRNFSAPGIAANNLKDITSGELLSLSYPLFGKYSPFYEALGDATLEYIEKNMPLPFGEGLDQQLVKTENKEEVKKRIKNQLGDKDWIDGQPSGKFWWEYKTPPPNDWNYNFLWD